MTSSQVSQVQANETPPMSAEDIETLRDENGLIAGKFKTAEDMVKSYKELEGKLGDIERTKEEPEAVEETEQNQEEQPSLNAEEFYGEGLASVLEEVGIDVEDITQRFSDTGEINEDDYSKLGEAGFSKQVIDTYLQGLRGATANAEDISNAAATEIKNSIGGDEAYEQLVQWSSKNFTKAPSVSGREMIQLNVKGLPPQRFYKSTGWGGKSLKSGQSSKGKWVPLEGFGNRPGIQNWFIKGKGWDQGYGSKLFKDIDHYISKFAK